jgi:DNA repair protein RadC
VFRERPVSRELARQLQQDGAAELSVAELLGVVLGHAEPLQVTGYATDQLLKARTVQEVRGLAVCTDQEAIRILAAVEVARRIARQNTTLPVVNGPDDVVHAFRARPFDQRELVYVLYLNDKRQVVYEDLIAVGGAASVQVDIASVVKYALDRDFPALIVVHNHPQGTTEASDEDHLLAKKLGEACALFDIQLLDVMIVTAAASRSLLTSWEG